MIKSERRVREAITLYDAFNEIRAYEEANNGLVKKISQSKPFEKQFISVLWDIAKKASFKGAIIEGIDKIYKL